MADNNPSKKDLIAEKIRLREAGKPYSHINKQIKTLNKSKSREQSTDSRATGTTVGTTDTSRETPEQLIHRWSEKVKSLSAEIKANEGDEAAIKKLKKQISILKSKIKKKREKHNTGAATPRSIAQSIISQLTATTAGTKTTAGGLRQKKVKRDVARNGKVQIQCKTTNSMFPQLPPPILNEYTVSAIHKSCVYHKDLDPKDTKLYSYESFDYGQKYSEARLFFIELEGQRKKRKKDELYDFHDGYVAYVTDESYFEMKIEELRGKTVSGYLYMSVNCVYTIDQQKENGFITFLIPFVKTTSASDTDETVCGIDVQIEIPSTTTNTVEGFVTNFKKYILFSNIPLEGEKTTITENVVQRLVKSLEKIKNATKTTLKRTDKGFKTCYSKPDVTVWNHVECKSADDKETLWKGTMKMVVPYSGLVEMGVAKDIIARAMSQCQYALLQYHEDKTNNITKEESVRFFEQIWGATVWILTIEMSKEKMNFKRIADLSTNLMQMFLTDVYKKYISSTLLIRHIQPKKKPFPPYVLLDNIIHNSVIVDNDVSTKLSAPRKLPVVIPAVNASNQYSEGVTVGPAAATQFRDW